MNECIVDKWLNNYSWKSLLFGLVLMLLFGFLFGFSKFSMFLLGFYWAIITFKSIIYKEKMKGGKNG
jgi:hypothetical protein